MASDDPTTSAFLGSRAAPKEGRKLSEVLSDIAADHSRERISVGDLLTAMHDRALAALLFIFALPNVIPTPPGTSSVLGVPLIFLAAQLMLGLRPWLPKVITKRSMARSDFAALITRASPWLAKAERLLRPRLGLFAHPPAEYFIGAVCFLLTIILFLPIPLGNMLPALAICLLSLGILERDGVWTLIGLGTAVGAVALVWGVLYALIKSALFILAKAFA
ncbi:exopolysaccharide biosynthesis protein [Rhodoligotrophos defluvii]|uniref:exopolysaccharide biosynthesis protein n=1 Tax=Rhodoligotrophos defluvii TaxID=2561934 RepID=UPI0010C986E2|nr:exopolysaccharide biosynthesis protein [Rhodoligotrophos defluvii]